MKEEHFIKTKSDKDYSFITRAVYHQILRKFGATARITNLMDMLKYTYEIDEWLLYDPKNLQGAMFTSYLIDRMIDFKDGKPVDFTEIYGTILKEGDFLNSEKRVFEIGNIEERLWAIFLAVDDPINKNKIEE